MTPQDAIKWVDGKMPKCLRAEGCFCNLDNLVKEMVGDTE